MTTYPVDYDPIWTTPNIVVITKGGVQTIKTELCEDCLARQVQEVCEDCYELKAECVCNAEIEPFILKYTSSIEGHVRRECFACKNYGRCLAFPRGSHWPGRLHFAAKTKEIPEMVYFCFDCISPCKFCQWPVFGTTLCDQCRLGGP